MITFFINLEMNSGLHLIFWEEKSKVLMPETFLMYIRFLKVDGLGFLLTMLARSLISLLGLCSNFWKKAGYLPRIWFLGETKLSAR